MSTFYGYCYTAAIPLHWWNWVTVSSAGQLGVAVGEKVFPLDIWFSVKILLLHWETISINHNGETPYLAQNQPDRQPSQAVREGGKRTCTGLISELHDKTTKVLLRNISRLQKILHSCDNISIPPSLASEQQKSEKQKGTSDEKENVLMSVVNKEEGEKIKKGIYTCIVAVRNVAQPLHQAEPGRRKCILSPILQSLRLWAARMTLSGGHSSKGMECR